MRFFLQMVEMGKQNAKENKNNNKVVKPQNNSLKNKEIKRKQVFKPVLENPFTQASWPFIEPELGSSITDALQVVLTRAKQHGKTTLMMGFNPVNEALEAQAKGNDKNIRYVFVTKSDLPSIVTQHFPMLICTASKGVDKSIKLIQLTRGSNARLTEILGEDASVLALTEDSSLATEFYGIFDKAEDVGIEFIDQMYENFQKPSIQFLSTFAPTGKLNKKN